MFDQSASCNLTLILKLNGETDKGNSMKAPFGTPPDLRGEWLLQIDDPGQLQPKPKLHVFLPGRKMAESSKRSPIRITRNCRIGLAPSVNTVSRQAWW